MSHNKVTWRQLIGIFGSFFYRLLAHELEEENNRVADHLKSTWDKASYLKKGMKFIPLNRHRFELFVRMGFRAFVSRKCCEEVYVLNSHSFSNSFYTFFLNFLNLKVMSVDPDHFAWKRVRLPVHSGVDLNSRG